LREISHNFVKEKREVEAAQGQLLGKSRKMTPPQGEGPTHAEKRMRKLLRPRGKCLWKTYKRSYSPTTKKKGNLKRFLQQKEKEKKTAPSRHRERYILSNRLLAGVQLNRSPHDRWKGRGEGAKKELSLYWRKERGVFLGGKRIDSNNRGEGKKTTEEEKREREKRNVHLFLRGREKDHDGSSIALIRER